MNPVPRGIEILVKKAAVDAEFRELLLGERAAAADRIGLVLEPAESEMLRTIPRPQLERVIGQTAVPLAARAAFLGYAAVVMLATGTPTAFADNIHVRTGINPDLVEKKRDPVDLEVGTGAIEGAVVEIGGVAAAGVTVEILETDFSTVTAADGTFLIKDVPPGVYDVRIHGGAYASKTQKNVTVKAAAITAISFAVETVGEGGARPDLP